MNPYIDTLSIIRSFYCTPSLLHCHTKIDDFLAAYPPCKQQKSKIQVVKYRSINMGEVQIRSHPGSSTATNYKLTL